VPGELTGLAHAVRDKARANINASSRHTLSSSRLMIMSGFGVIVSSSMTCKKDATASAHRCSDQQLGCTPAATTCQPLADQRHLKGAVKGTYTALVTTRAHILSKQRC
jgi:hypothetical protein